MSDRYQFERGFTPRALEYEGIDAPTYDPLPSPMDRSIVSPANRGQVFNLPAGRPPFTFALEACRLDAGTWDLRVGLLSDGPFGGNFLVSGPQKSDPLAPYVLVLDLGVGAVTWQEGYPIVPRGMHVIRGAEILQVRVLATEPLVEPARIVVGAMKVLVPCEPAHRFYSPPPQTVGAGGTMTWEVPMGARTLRAYGNTLAPPQSGVWRDANFAALCDLGGVPLAGVPQNVPVIASFLETSPLPAGGTMVVVWDCET